MEIIHCILHVRTYSGVFSSFPAGLNQSHAVAASGIQINSMITLPSAGCLRLGFQGRGVRPLQKCLVSIGLCNSFILKMKETVEVALKGAFSQKAPISATYLWYIYDDINYVHLSLQPTKLIFFIIYFTEIHFNNFNKLMVT